MQSFTIKYKQSYAMCVLSCFLMIILSPLIGLMFIHALKDLDYGALIASSLFFGLMIWMFSYTILLIISSKRGMKKIFLRNGILSFPKSNISHKLVDVHLSSIASPQLKHQQKTHTLVLKFTTEGKRYVFDNTSMNDKDFSILCNSIIKVSNRCKACQSSRVLWNGSLGHCSDCETMTPREADKFNWEDAYQA